MLNINSIQFNAPVRPPTIEFDLSVGAWYIRFRHAKVVKTLCDERPGVIATVDLDSRNEVVGLELLGVKQFSIRLLKEISPIDTSKVDFERAKFVQASNRQKQLSEA